MRLHIEEHGGWTLMAPTMVLGEKVLSRRNVSNDAGGSIVDVARCPLGSLRSQWRR